MNPPEAISSPTSTRPGQLPSISLCPPGTQAVQRSTAYELLEIFLIAGHNVRGADHNRRTSCTADWDTERASQHRCEETPIPRQFGKASPYHIVKCSVRRRPLLTRTGRTTRSRAVSGVLSFPRCVSFHRRALSPHILFAAHPRAISAARRP